MAAKVMSNNSLSKPNVVRILNVRTKFEAPSDKITMIEMLTTKCAIIGVEKTIETYIK